MHRFVIYGVELRQIEIVRSFNVQPEELEHLFNNGRPHYLQAAHFKVETENDRYVKLQNILHSKLTGLKGKYE